MNSEKKASKSPTKTELQAEIKQLRNELEALRVYVNAHVAGHTLPAQPTEPYPWMPSTPYPNIITSPYTVWCS